MRAGRSRSHRIDGCSLRSLAKRRGGEVRVAPRPGLEGGPQSWDSLSELLPPNGTDRLSFLKLEYLKHLVTLGSVYPLSATGRGPGGGQTTLVSSVYPSSRRPCPLQERFCLNTGSRGQECPRPANPDSCAVPRDPCDPGAGRAKGVAAGVLYS